MKARYIVLGLVMMLALSVRARVFEGGERLYINMEAKSVKESGDDNLKYGWYSTTSNYNYAYFFNGTTSAWSTQVQQYSGSVWYVVVPAGDWDNVILTRHNSANASWDTKITQTGNINIGASYALNKNYIDNFYYGTYKEEADWQSITLSPSGSPVDASAVDGVNKEVIDACTSSIGDPLSLQPILAGNPLVYDYNNSAAHAWFKWNGSAWVALDGQKTGKHSNVNAWGYEGGAELHETIGAAGSHTYYFLWTEQKSMRRFVEVAVTKDCSPTCEITDFGVVTSHVNAHDSTYVLDGIVAFKDATGKTLRISVTDAKGEHHVDYANPSTPLVFSLDNLYADGATGVTATASFLGTTYSASATFDAPNAIIGIHTSTANAMYSQTTTLTPSTAGTDGFRWHDGNTTDHERTIPAYNFDTTIIYTYYEYETAPEVGGNLIVNGDFSQAESYYGTIHRSNTPFGSAIGDYNFWGKDVTSSSDFYDTYKDDTQNLFGGFSIVTDANAFWKRYTKKIAAKASTHYALFDADNTGEKAAWRTETNAGQPNLKLAKGTNYMFSFWVANINNYGEMNNAAKLQFELSYSLDGGSTWTVEKLGNPIDLNDYPDNLWHQNSHVYVSAVTTDRVRISVKDLNSSSNPGGNDFALDDIKFQPISIVSQAIKNCERFVVTISEPAITVQQPQITITQTPACGKTDFTMQVKVNYSTLNNTFPVTLQLTDDIYGPLFATPITINPLTNPNDTTITLPTATYAMLVADGKVHTLTAQLIRINGAGVDKGGQNSNTYTSPGIPAIKTPVLTVIEPSCDKTTFDLQVATDYVAFKGTKLHYEWDGTEWTNSDLPTLTYKETIWQTATGKLKDLPADGLNHTLRVYSDTTIDCEYTFAAVAAPVVPTIDTVKTSFSELGCTDLYTTLTFDLSYTHQQGSFTYWVDGQSEQTATYSEADDSQKTLTALSFGNIPADGKDDHVLHVSFAGSNSCIKTYTLPAVPLSPMITSVTVSGVPATVLCAATDYPVTVEIVTPYDATGKNIVLSGAKDTTVVATGTKTTVSFNKQDINGAAQTITAAYAASPACNKSASYTPPAQLACNVYRDTICEGDNYTDNGFNIIAPPIGEAVHVNASKDTLYLLVADGHSMYSKWTDVLFIDNADGRFVAYQWYENGALLSGETQQRLYNPNGLSGSYYCVMTTTDGKQIYTCEKDFDKVTPSRTQSSAPAATVVRKVRVTPHVYIIQESTGDETRPRKILTPYE